MQEKLRYFPGFNGLRFIAIMIVVFHHFLTFRNYFDDTVWYWAPSDRLVQFGVQFFFAGSGFLISYLLFAELQFKGHITLRKYFVRRLLRIWPAYFVLVILVVFVLGKISFFDIPHITQAYYSANYQIANTLYLLLLPQIAGIYFPTAPYLHHTYTVGMEVQFYLLWGLLFAFFNKYLKLLFVCFLAFIPILNFLNGLISAEVDSNWLVHKYKVIFQMLEYFRIPTFALGGLWALAYLKKAKWLNLFGNIWIQCLIYFLVILAVGFNLQPKIFFYEYISFLVLCVLSCAITGSKSLINFDSQLLNFLGKISYGIYLFHMIAIIICLKIAKMVFSDFSSLPTVIIVCTASLSLSIFFGWISFLLIEQKFLKLKSRFEVLK